MRSIALTKPKPGHTINQPFDLMAASADLLAVNELIGELTHADDGTPASTDAIRAARRIRDQLEACINRHRRA